MIQKETNLPGGKQEDQGKPKCSACFALPSLIERLVLKFVGFGIECMYYAGESSRSWNIAENQKHPFVPALKKLFNLHNNIKQYIYSY